MSENVKTNSDFSLMINKIVSQNLNLILSVKIAYYHTTKRECLLMAKDGKFQKLLLIG